MKLRLALFLVIVAINIFAITRINANIISQEEDLLRGINLSGRQRMLSQRIPMLTSVILREGVYPDVIERSTDIKHLSLNQAVEELESAINLMETSHNGLLYSSETLGLLPAPKVYRDFYLQKRVGFQDEPFGTINDQVLDFIDDAKQVLAIAKKIGQDQFTEQEKKILIQNYNHLYGHAFTELLSYIDQSVFIYESAGRDSLNKIKIFEPFLLGGSFAMLFIVWFFVFRPMEQQINTNFKLLEQQKDRFDLALQGASTGVWDWDLSSGTIYWSSVLLDILGLSHDHDRQIDRHYFQSLMHKSDRKNFNKAIKNHINKLTPFHVQGRLRHNDGHWVWVRFRGQAMRDKDNQAYRMLGSIEDITNIKSAEQQTNIFIQGIETANIPFAIVDLKDKTRSFIYTSAAFCNLTGYEKDKILDSNINIFTGPETSMNSLDQIDYAFSEGKPLSIKMAHYKADGVAFWNNVTLSPIHMNNSDDTHHQYYSVIFSDMTESIAREKQEVARQRNESLGSLAGSVAHEINNLLMPMTMAKDMLENELKDDCDPFAREQLDVMVDYANQAKNIVQGILTFSRKETKNMEKITLYTELENSISFIQNLMSNKTTLILEPPKINEDTKIQALINTTEIKQIITNLCRNAEDSFNGKDGKIIFTLSHRKLSNIERTKLDVVANQFAVITVKDNGSGIASDHLEKIFEPLFTTKDIGKGTGLGLSVVMGILRSWGGAITVNSVLGKGTTFEIFIPIYKNEDDFADLADLADLAEGFSDQDLQSLLN